MIRVKIARFPGQTKELDVPDGTTVAQGFSLAEMSFGGNDNLTVNGLAATGETVLQNGDRAIAAQGAKGNA